MIAMGVSVRRHSNGNFYIYARWVGEKGQQRANRSAGRSLKAANLIAQAARRRISMGQEPFGGGQPKRRASSPSTLSDYFEFHFLRDQEACSKPKTVSVYQANFSNYIGPALGSLAISGITRDDIREFLHGLLAERREREVDGEAVLAPLSRSTVGQIFRNLSAIFNHALDSEKIARNPCKHKALRKLVKGAPPKEEVEPLNRGQVEAFLSAAAKICPDCYALFLCLFHTGLRPGELAGLKWRDVDFRSGSIQVRRAIDQAGRVQTTKTEESKKPVAMSDVLAKALEAHGRDQRRYWLKRGKPMPEWVFPSQAGKPRSMQNLGRRQWAKCLKEAGITRRKLSSTRHTTATLLISAGVNPKVVQRILRHRSIKTTLDHYGHLYPDDAADAVAGLPGGAASIDAALPRD